jgi:hypothetical protein
MSFSNGRQRRAAEKNPGGHRCAGMNRFNPQRRPPGWRTFPTDGMFARPTQSLLARRAFFDFFAGGLAGTSGAGVVASSGAAGTAAGTGVGCGAGALSAGAGVAGVRFEESIGLVLIVWFNCRSRCDTGWVAVLHRLCRPRLHIDQ